MGHSALRPISTILASSPLLFAAAVTAAQAPPAPIAIPEAPPSTVTLRQTVNNVLVDVVVTDRNGQPVIGLGKDKFQVLENDRPQQISFFEEHKPDSAPAIAARNLQLPPDVYTNIPTTPPDNGPALVLLMDALNTPSADQVKTRLAMLEYLRRLPPGRRIAIFTLTSRLTLIQGFSSDPAILIASLDQVAALQKQSHLTDDAGQDTYADSMPKLAVGGAPSATPLFQSFVAHEQAWRVDQRVQYTLDALNSLATYLSALPGRKNLIWFSGSFPFGLGADSTIPQGAGSFQTESLDRARDYTEQLHATSELLKIARVAVYPMDPGGLPTPSMFSSAQNNNGSLQNGGALGKQVNQEASDELSAHATMDTLAEATGGRAFHNTTDLAAAIDAVTQIGSSYYTLAYAPSDSKYDGKYRKLTVKVDWPRVKLDYRRGYFAQDPEKSGADKLAHPAVNAAVLLRGAPAATGILFKVRVAPTESAMSAPQTRTVRYSINWSVDLHGVPLVQSASGMVHGGFELAAVAYDRNAKAVSSTATPISLLLHADEYRLYLKSGLQFHQELDLPVGPVFLRVAVIDNTSSRAGATEIPLSVEPLAAKTNAAQSTTAH